MADRTGDDPVVGVEFVGGVRCGGQKFLLDTTGHGVRFPGACLSVGEDGDCVPVEGTVEVVLGYD